MIQKRILVIHPSPRRPIGSPAWPRSSARSGSRPIRKPPFRLRRRRHRRRGRRRVVRRLARPQGHDPPADRASSSPGDDEATARRAADGVAARRSTSTSAVTSPAEPREVPFLRALGRLVEHARLKTEAADLRRSLGLQEAKVKDVLGEISEIKSLLNSGFLREIEKRLAIEARYVGSQKERQRFEIDPPQDLRGRRRQQPSRHRPRHQGHRPGRERLDLHHGGERDPRPLPQAPRLGQRLPDPLRFLQVHRPARRPGLRRVRRPLRPGDQRRQPDLRPPPEQALHDHAQDPAAEPARRADHARTQRSSASSRSTTRPSAGQPGPDGFTREDQQILARPVRPHGHRHDQAQPHPVRRPDRACSGPIRSSKRSSRRSTP